MLRGHAAAAGFVINHIIALKRGGAHAPSNMQKSDWESVESRWFRDAGGN